MKFIFIGQTGLCQNGTCLDTNNESGHFKSTG